jgi:hypothetical protein
VQHDGLSLIYGRVFPPAEAADPNRVPGFIGVLGPEGPLGYAMNVTISEANDDRGRPQTITVRGSGRSLNINLRFDVESAVINRAAGSGPLSSGLDFLQLRGTYTSSGRAGDRALNFSAPVPPPAGKRVEPVLQRQTRLRLRPTAELRAKALEAQCPRPLGEWIFGVGPKAVARLTSVAVCAPRRLPRFLAATFRPLRPPVV